MSVAFLAAGITVQGQEVAVVWQEGVATVTVSDDIQSWVKVGVNGGDVSVEQNAAVAEEITYRLSGQSDNGSFVHMMNLTLFLRTKQKSSSKEWEIVISHSMTN